MTGLIELRLIILWSTKEKKATTLKNMDTNVGCRTAGSEATGSGGEVVATGLCFHLDELPWLEQNPIGDRKADRMVLVVVVVGLNEKPDHIEHRGTLAENQAD